MCIFMRASLILLCFNWIFLFKLKSCNYVLSTKISHDVLVLLTKLFHKRVVRIKFDIYALFSDLLIMSVPDKGFSRFDIYVLITLYYHWVETPVEFGSTCKISVYMYRGRRGRDRIVVGFTTACEINTYHQYSCDFESRSCRSVSNATSGFFDQ
jgi:hypothetical protein